MKISSFFGVAAVLTLALSLGACSQTPTPVIAPVTMDASQLQGETVDLVVGQVLNINTGDLAADSYRGTVSDSEIARFTKGYTEGSATFNPGVEALKEGSTSVTLSNEDSGIEDVTFTVDVGE